jgi:RNA polymerase sigma-70 factor (ECF subfamily)
MARSRAVISERLSGAGLSGSRVLIEALYERDSRFLIGDHQLVHDREFERLYSEHSQPLFGFLVYRTGDRALAEDILTETFVRVLRARRPYDRRRGASEKTWLYTIALNLLRDHGRRRAAEGRALARAERLNPGRASDPSLSAVEERESIHRAMEILSGAEREAIALRFGAGMTAPEIAALTDERVSTVEGRLYRALRKLRDELS